MSFIEQKLESDNQNRGFLLHEISSLIIVLSEEATKNQPFDQISVALRDHFNKNDFFKIGLTLVMMLQNPDLLPHSTQRLAAIYLLWDMYSTEPVSTNPFANVFVHLLNLTSDDDTQKCHGSISPLSNAEKYFLAQLVTMPTKELSKRTPLQIQQIDSSNIHIVDTSGLQLALAEKHSEIPLVSKSAISSIVSCPNDVLQGFEEANKLNMPKEEAQRQTIEKLVTGPDPFYDRVTLPKFISLAPPLHIALDEELAWINPPIVESYQPIWDNSMCSVSSSSSDAKRFMTRSFSAPLLLQQQAQLLGALAKDPKLVYHVGLTPAKLPSLVENNPLVAIEALMKLTESNQINEYLSVLVNMEMSLHSMEVVNRLTTSIELPSEFIYLYISNCISTCEGVKDRYVQNRLVRLVCVFLQSLIRNKIIDIKDIIIEVQAFCIDFNRIREAGALFRLLKTLDNAESEKQK